MTDFSKAKIYEIVCNITGFAYIWSTIQKLSRRLQGHIWNYKQYLDNKSRYVTSFKILENNNHEMILIEEYSCESKNTITSKRKILNWKYWVCKHGYSN